MTFSDDVSSEPIVGWRSWYLSGAEPRLKSMAGNIHWEPGVAIVAENVDAFGIHAFSRASDAQSYVEPNEGNRDRFKLRRVYGSVYLWGKVICCENGYRAQYAYPKDLRIERIYHPGQPEEDVPSRLRALYGCETAWM